MYNIWNIYNYELKIKKEKYIENNISILKICSYLKKKDLNELNRF